MNAGVAEDLSRNASVVLEPVCSDQRPLRVPRPACGVADELLRVSVAAPTDYRRGMFKSGKEFKGDKFYKMV